VGDLPDNLRNAAEMYAGCVSGAMQKDAYLGLIEQAGFVNMTVQKIKPILIPDDILLKYLSPEALKAFVASQTGILSVTVYAEKPGEAPTEKKKLSLKELPLVKDCCTPGSGCC
jgi:hypothetical protein